MAPAREGPCILGQAGRHEHVGHRGIAVPDEQRALEDERDGLGQVAGPGFSRVGEFLPQPENRLVQPAVRPAAWSSSAMSASADPGRRVSARSASSAATLPEPSQIDASGASRYRRGIPDSST